MTGTIPLKQMLPLVGLTISAFIFNTSEFMPIGLLIDISRSFSMTEAQTGTMITVYAWVVAVLSLPLMLLTCNIESRRLLLGTVALFLAGQIGSGLAVSFWMLMLARVSVACAHAVFWSIAAPIAVRLVSKEHRSLALSMIITGTSIAMIAGLPMGRAIGLYVGWRITFLSLAGISLLSILYLFIVFPCLKQNQPFYISDLPHMLKNRILLAIYIITVLFSTSYYTVYSYIEPFMQQIAHMSDTWITLILTVFGVSGLLGSIIFSHFYNQFRFVLIRLSLICLAGLFFLLGLASQDTRMIISVCVLLGITATVFNVTFQAELIQCVPAGAAAVAMSIFSGIFNLGIGSGTWIGGKAVDAGLLGDIGYAGGCIAAIAALYCLIVFIPGLKRKME